MNYVTERFSTKNAGTGGKLMTGAAGLSLILVLICCASSVLAQDYRIKAVQQLVPYPYGGRAGWSPGPNNLIAYDSINSTTGFYDVWTMNPDGTNQRCLTCNWEPPPVQGDSNPQPNYNKGNPDWDPTGQYIVFEVQRNDTTYTADQNTLSRPGVGEDLFLYIMDAAGKNFWLVAASTDYTAHDGGVLHPRFSHGSSSRGLMLLWAQETAKGTNAYSGRWEMKIASFSIVNGAPVTTLLQTLSPGGSAQCQGPFYETHGFSLDDSTFFYSGNPQKGCSGATLGYDVYSYNLNTQVYTDITNTPNIWEEHARSSPIQEKLLYASSEGQSQTGGNLIEEFWTMNYDGSDKKKMTWFTDSRGEHFNATFPNFYIPSLTSAGRVDWSQDGLQAVVYTAEVTPGQKSAFGETGSNWLITLEPSSTTANTASYLTYPLAPNSIADSFGTNLATGVFSATGNLGTNLGGTTVKVEDATGATRSANLFFANSQQVNWQVPVGTAMGPAFVTTTSGNGTVSTDIFDVESVGPGLFGVDASGSGPAAAYITPGGLDAFHCSAAYNCTTVPINVGGGGVYLILFGTGIQYHQSQVMVTFTSSSGAVLASVAAAYASAQGGFVGLDQINVELPRSLAGSGIVNVTLTIGDQTSNAVQVQFQ